MLLRVFGIAWNQFRTFSKTMKALRKLENLRKAYYGSFNIKKVTKVDGRYFWYNHVPGFPSKAFDKYFTEELNLLSPFGNGQKYLRSVILSITNKCGYKCEHCYACDPLDHQELLRSEELVYSVKKFQEIGLKHIYVIGG